MDPSLQLDPSLFFLGWEISWNILTSKCLSSWNDILWWNIYSNSKVYNRNLLNSDSQSIQVRQRRWETHPINLHRQRSKRGISSSAHQEEPHSSTWLLPLQSISGVLWWRSPAADISQRQTLALSYREVELTGKSSEVHHFLQCVSLSFRGLNTRMFILMLMDFMIGLEQVDFIIGWLVSFFEFCSDLQYMVFMWNYKKIQFLQYVYYMRLLWGFFISGRKNGKREWSVCVCDLQECWCVLPHSCVCLQTWHFDRTF